VEETVVLPTPIGPGHYTLSVALLEPATRWPAVTPASEPVDETGWLALDAVTVA
jgi:hypothetical protein